MGTQKNHQSKLQNTQKFSTTSGKKDAQKQVEKNFSQSVKRWQLGGYNYNFFGGELNFNGNGDTNEGIPKRW